MAKISGLTRLTIFLAMPFFIFGVFVGIGQHFETKQIADSSNIPAWCEIEAERKKRETTSRFECDAEVVTVREFNPKWSYPVPKALALGGWFMGMFLIVWIPVAYGLRWVVRGFRSSRPEASKAHTAPTP